MTISLTYDATTIELPPDLLWSDELSWQPVEQSAERSVTGALIVSSALRLTGRPITLVCEDDISAWVTRGTLGLLRAWAAVPGREMVLHMNGTDYDVVFRHQDGAIEARPVVHYSEMQTEDFYLATFRLMEI